MTVAATESLAFGETTPTQKRGEERRLRRRFYGAALGAALIMALLGSAAAYAANHVSTLPVFLFQVGAWLVGVNLVGAAVMFRPLDPYLRGEAVTLTKVERGIRALPAAFGVWLSFLAVGAMIGHAAMVHGPQELLAPSLLVLHAGTLINIGVFALYLGLAGYFWAIDYCADLRAHLWRHGISIRARRGKLMRRVVAALLAIALAPILLSLSDQWVHPSGTDAGSGAPIDMPSHHAHMQQTLEMDVLGAIFLSVLVTVLMARGLSRPVRVLLNAMRRVDRGDLGVRVPVVSDDEFGMLAEQFGRMVDGLRERDRIRKTFSRFVPERIAAALLADEGAIAPKESEATVLFTDIERFTSIAAGLEPRGILDMLNAYFDAVARIVHERGGVITQFQGDAVLASFNLPTADPDHVVHAVQAAFAIQATLDEVVLPGGMRLRTQIGVSTGPVVGGTVGGGERLGYTVHGNTVNLAARLEALNKAFGTGVLISARTAELVDGVIELHDRGTVDVRGFPEPLHVFEPQIDRGVAMATGEV